MTTSPLPVCALSLSLSVSLSISLTLSLLACLSAACCCLSVVVRYMGASSVIQAMRSILRPEEQLEKACHGKGTFFLWVTSRGVRHGLFSLLPVVP